MHTRENSPEGGPALQYEPLTIDSLDSRVLQYKYALIKLNYLISAIDKIILFQDTRINSVVIIHHVTHLASYLFGISEPVFGPRIAALESYKIPKNNSVTISQVVTHIPYDMKDFEVVSLDSIPNRKQSFACLRTLKLLATICKEAYERRLRNASKEIKNDSFVADLDLLYKNLFNGGNNYDLSLQSTYFEKSSILYDLDASFLEAEDNSEATLIDIDLLSLFEITHECRAILLKHEPLITKMRSIKLQPKESQDGFLATVPFSAYNIHRVFFWALRINELYFILRKYGRQILQSNMEHLVDQTFQSYMDTPSHYATLLDKLREAFFHSKKNGVLIATITRFIRMSSKQEINSALVLEFSGFILQSVQYISSLINDFINFGRVWLGGEIGFRNQFDLPLGCLPALQVVVEEKERDFQERSRKILEARQAQVKKPNPTPRSTPRANVNGQNRLSTYTRQMEPVLFENESLSTRRIDSPVTGNVRPNTMKLLHKNSSSSSLNSEPGVSAAHERQVTKARVVGRPRSNSQPLSLNAAAAAAALKKMQSPPAQQTTAPRAPPKSEPKRIPQKKSVLANSMEADVKRSAQGGLSKSQVTSNPEEAKDEAASRDPPKLTASQKFQQHLLEASRSGRLYGKEKEVLTNVVFDPNNPTQLDIRGQARAHKAENVPVSVPVPAPAPVPLMAPVIAETKKLTLDGPPTRAQVTRHNTKRNSVVMHGSDRETSANPSRLSFASNLTHSSSTDSSIVVKKVRFYGVPEYTPAEDAPTSQASRILKNFAIFKAPSISHAAFKQKDNLLKKEESILFKHQHEVGTVDTPVTRSESA